MKKPYSINYLTNTVTVNPKFLAEASTLGDAADVMNELRGLGMKIVAQPRKSSETKPSRLNYKKMEKYISCVEDSEAYLAEFEAVKAAAQATKSSYAVVWKWFKQKFPNFNGVPEFNDDLKIVVTPANYTA